jgi:hypothetical protein
MVVVVGGVTHGNCAAAALWWLDEMKYAIFSSSMLHSLSL